MKPYVKQVRPGRWVVITGGGSFFHMSIPFPDQTSAFAHALAEVGLTEKNTEKETNR